MKKGEKTKVVRKKQAKKGIKELNVTKRKVYKETRKEKLERKRKKERSKERKKKLERKRKKVKSKARNERK